jgi:hypothetical protein
LHQHYWENYNALSYVRGFAGLKSSVWNQIVPYVVAAIATAYLIYVLVVQGDPLQFIHFWIFLLVVVLVLAPLAGRLKIWNLIDFDSKFQSLRNETKKELDQIRNQVSSVVQTSIVPMQHQWTVLGVDERMAKKLSESIEEQFKLMSLHRHLNGTKEIDSTRIQFLRRADFYRSRIYVVLSAAHFFHIVIREGRIPESGELGPDATDGRISHTLKHILDGGVELFVPPEEVAKTIEELRSIEKLLDLYRSVDSKETNVPSEQEGDQLFDNINSGLSGILAGVLLYGSQAIVAQQNVKRVLKELKEEWEVSSESPEDNLQNKS